MYRGKSVFALERAGTSARAGSSAAPLKSFFRLLPQAFLVRKIEFRPPPEDGIRVEAARAAAAEKAEAEEERASTAAACIADPPSIWQLVAYGPNA